jgi:transcriptional regulator with XRE-family HTH domain
VSADRDTGSVPSKERAADRGARLARHDLVAVGADIRTARLSAGLSLRLVGRAVGMSYTHVGRIERAVHPNVSAMQLTRIGAVVGLDVRVRTFPGPAPLRDAGQLALLDRLRARLHPDLILRTEVPLPIEGDQRAWDGVIRGFIVPPGSTLPAEAETKIHDFQAQTRRVMLKCRDAGLDHILLVVAGTRNNRRAITAAGAAVGELFPVPGRDALTALAAGEHPGGSALVFL